MSPLSLGKILNEDIEVYHGSSAVSKTKLDVFRDSPRLYQKRFITREVERGFSSDALTVGSAVDALALEGPEVFAAKFSTVPEDAPKRPSKAQINAKKPSPATQDSIAYWSRFEEANAGKTLLTDAQAELSRKCADALAADETFARLMKFGESQVTFRIAGDKFALQCRPDRWLEEGCELTDGMPCIIDVKTIAELPADGAGLPSHIAAYGYHRGAYLYRELVSTVMGYKSGYRPPFILVFVEKREPFAVVSHIVDEEALGIGEREVGDALGRLRACMETGIWPSSLRAPLSLIGLPSYYVKRANVDAPNQLWG